MQATTERGRIVRDGMGGFLNPPTHPEHTMSVETDLRRRKENRSRMSLAAAAECDWLTPDTRLQARELLEAWDRPPIDAPEVRDWIAQVLGYFRGCYKGPAGAREWHASDLIIDANRDPLEHVDEHAGVNLIRRYYPDYQPTADDFARAYWGTKPSEEE